jgi:tRNA threonylcarbamoyladenosine biosynthesis protein TsaE
MDSRAANSNLAPQTQGLKTVSNIINSESELKPLASKILQNNRDSIEKDGLLIALNGEMGAGKTAFVKAFAASIDTDLEKKVTSPTFAVMNQFQTSLNNKPINFVHIDLYRILGENTDNMDDPKTKQTVINAIDDLDIDFQNSIVFIEWIGKNIAQEFSDNFIEIQINTISENRRELNLVMI